ncbi:MAG: hypothetical protein ACSHX6_01455 [Akkermansiaceae bacterium]
MKNSPYTPPSTEATPPATPSKNSGSKLSLIGLILYTLPVFGRPFSTFILNRAYYNLGRKNITYEAFTEDLRLALTIFLITLAIGLIGAICILTSFFSKKHRAPWFFYTTIIISILWGISIFPYGFIIGGPISIIFLAKGKEFIPNNDSQTIPNQ